MRAWWIWLGAMSLLAFALMGLDKNHAKKGAGRVRERTLFLVALLGGSPGAIVGMYAFRHKTRHWYFKYGLPLLLFLQVAVSLIFVNLYQTGGFHFIQMYQ